MSDTPFSGGFKEQLTPANKDKKILILSWSMFTVPEAPSDV